MEIILNEHVLCAKIHLQIIFDSMHCRLHLARAIIFTYFDAENASNQFTSIKYFQSQDQFGENKCMRRRSHDGNFVKSERTNERTKCNFNALEQQ